MPRRAIRDPQSPITSFQKLSAGLETMPGITDRRPGSASTLNNFLVTESHALKAVTGYNRLFNPPTDFTVVRYLSNIVQIPFEIISIAGSGSYLLGLALVKRSSGKYDKCLVGGEVNIREPKTLHIFYTVESGISQDTSTYHKLLVVDKKLLVFGKSFGMFLLDIENLNSGVTRVDWSSVPNPHAPSMSWNTKPAVGDEKYWIGFAVVYYSEVGFTKRSSIIRDTIGKDIVDWGSSSVTITLNPADVLTTDPNIKGWRCFMSIRSDATIQERLYEISNNVDGELIPVTDTSITINKDSITLIDVEAPTANTTHPIQCGEVKQVNGRLWATQISSYNGKSYPYRVMWSGTDEYRFNFAMSSVSNGAGYFSIDGGGADFPLAIVNFRMHDGSPAINILTGNENSLGKRWAVASEQITVGNSTVQTFVPVEQVNAFGTYAADSVMTSDNDLYFFSQQGIISSRTNTGQFNVIANNNISLTISNVFNDINTTNSSLVRSCYDKIRICWLVHSLKSSKTFILTYDFVHEAYSIIDVPAQDVFTCYEDDLVDTVLCMVHDNDLYYFTCKSYPQHKLVNEVEFNFQPITETTIARPFGRILNVQAQWESLEQGEFDFWFKGLTKDNELITKHVPFSEKEDSTDDMYLVYNAYVNLYREGYIVDEFAVGIKSEGIPLVLHEYSVSYNPVTRDWGKNRYGRRPGTLIPSTNT